MHPSTTSSTLLLMDRCREGRFRCVHDIVAITFSLLSSSVIDAYPQSRCMSSVVQNKAPTPENCPRRSCSLPVPVVLFRAAWRRAHNEATTVFLAKDAEGGETNIDG